MRRTSLADEQVNNIQVVVMYSNMQWSQTILQKQKQHFISMWYFLNKI